VGRNRSDADPLNRVATAIGAGLPAGRARFSTAVHLAADWGWSLVMLPALGVAPPAWQQPRQEVAVDLPHHLVYATGTGAAFRAFE
jgi:hypothetical protein